MSCHRDRDDDHDDDHDHDEDEVVIMITAATMMTTRSSSSWMDGMRIDGCWNLVGWMSGCCWMDAWMLDGCWTDVRSMLDGCWDVVGCMLDACWMHARHFQDCSIVIGDPNPTFPEIPKTSSKTFKPVIFETKIIDSRSKNRSFPNIPKVVWRPPDHQNSTFSTPKSSIEDRKIDVFQTSQKWSGDLQTVKK